MPNWKWATRIDGPVAVISDVHGYHQPLERILRELSCRPDARSRWIVLIGDLVDRGPNPCAVLDLVAEFVQQGIRLTAVMGNHELAMAGALDWVNCPAYSDWGKRWVSHYNSVTTFESYGASAGDLAGLKSLVPAMHHDMLVSMPWMVEHPQYLFVHAGLDPVQPFDLQKRILQARDFQLNRPIWLCGKELIDSPIPQGCHQTVVSGHVKVDEVQFRPKRILIDTSGGESDRISCVLLPENIVMTADGEVAGASNSPGKRSWWNVWS